ncbi:MAG: GNAT family N-acetyltransferase [Burkholderiaceae bacterium]
MPQRESFFKHRVTRPVALHNSEARRFELTVDGLLCECSYQLQGNVMVITHTGVPRALEGRGIAAALVQAALAWAQAQGLRVQPLCSYVSAYMQRHPDTLALLA